MQQAPKRFEFLLHIPIFFIVPLQRNPKRAHDVYTKNNANMELLSTIGLIFLITISAFLLMNIRHIFTGKEFRGGCASNNPMLREKIGDCPVCGKTADETVCKMPEVKA